MSVDIRGLVELVALSLFCGLLWRAEVEYRGWEGLIWLMYFHASVPIGAALFLAWVARSDAAPRGRRRVALLVVAGGYAALALGFVATTLGVLFTTGPSALPLLGAHPGWIFALAALAIVGVPTGAFLVGRLLGARLPWRALPLSVALAAASGPAGLAILRVLEPGHADAIHVVKTGAAVPFVVLALGAPWVLSLRKPTEDAEAGARVP